MCFLISSSVGFSSGNSGSMFNRMGHASLRSSSLSSPPRSRDNARNETISFLVIASLILEHFGLFDKLDSVSSSGLFSLTSKPSPSWSEPIFLSCPIELPLRLCFPPPSFNNYSSKLVKSASAPSSMNCHHVLWKYDPRLIVSPNINSGFADIRILCSLCTRSDS